MNTAIVILIAVTELFFLGLLLLTGYMLISGILTVPWVRTNKKISSAMMNLACIKDGDRILDLGSGDGSLVLHAVDSGAHGIGIERIALLVYFARLRAWLLRKQDKASFQRGNMFNINLPDADVVFAYLFPEINKRLVPRLIKRYPSKTRVVSRDFSFTDLVEIRREDIGKTKLYLYEIP